MALTESDIFEEVVVTPRRAFPALPDTRVIERSGWLQIVTPTIRSGALNEVIHSALNPVEADDTIEATIAEYRELGLRFRWNAGPGSAPENLGRRLAARGLKRHVALGMARSTHEGDSAIEPSIDVAEVDDASVDTYSQVLAAGWGLEPAYIAGANRSTLAMPERTHHLFLARVGGVPAGVGSYAAFRRSAYLIGAVVLPPFRGKGVYRALVTARLRHARASSIPLATSHANADSSAPILRRLGFSTVCEIPLYTG